MDIYEFAKLSNFTSNFDVARPIQWDRGCRELGLKEGCRSFVWAYDEQERWGKPLSVLEIIKPAYENGKVRLVRHEKHSRCDVIDGNFETIAKTIVEAWETEAEQKITPIEIDVEKAERFGLTQESVKYIYQDGEGRQISLSEMLIRSFHSNINNLMSVNAKHLDYLKKLAA